MAAQLTRPTAAAAVEEDAAFWEDALDIDDSDLGFDAPAPSPLLPANTTTTASHPHLDKPPHPSHHHIPRPAAAAVLDATLFRSAAGSPTTLGRGDAQAADADFLLPPWLCALQFLGNEDRAWKRPGIGVIKGEEKLRRAPLVAGVVTSCKPNGLGDLFLTIKDPTDSIGVSVHKKVLLEGNIGEDISIGCAILLSKVAIFRPSRKTCYLNCTKGKVVKVLRKDCAAPSKQVTSSSNSERSEGEGSAGNIMMKNVCRERMKVTEVSHEHHGTPDSNNSTSTWDIYGRCSLRSKQKGELQLLAGDPRGKHISNCSTDGSDAVPPDGYEANDETANCKIDTDNKHGSDRNMNTELDYMPVKHPKNGFSVANACSVQPTKETATTITGSLNPKRAMSVASVADWTDDQLSELFTDY